MENNYTIAEKYTLPSKGKIYSKEINPEIRLRSMTTEEEMKRLGHSDRPNELLAEIIDDCIIDNKDIKSYDLCVSDFQYLMYKLRIVTYGSDYNIETICPICGHKHSDTIDLEQLKLIEYSEELNNHLNITLPVSNKRIKLKLQTPRVIDDIKIRRDQIISKSPNTKVEPAFLYNIVSFIDTVDDRVIDDFKLEAFVRKLSMKDVNYIINSIKKFNFGIDSKIKCKCDNCGSEYETYLPITGEFFGPTID